MLFGVGRFLPSNVVEYIAVPMAQDGVCNSNGRQMRKMFHGLPWFHRELNDDPPLMIPSSLCDRSFRVSDGVIRAQTQCTLVHHTVHIVQSVACGQWWWIKFHMRPLGPVFVHGQRCLRHVDTISLHVRGAWYL